MSDLSPTPAPSSNPGGPLTRPTGTRSTHLMKALTTGSESITSARRGWADTFSSTRARVRTVRPAHVLVRTAIIGFVAIVVSGIGHALSHPARDESREAAQLVASLIDGRAGLDNVPENFQDELGYLPVAEAETLVNPDGGCSTPGRIGPEYFDTACRTHDLGYDTLRYAEGTGIRLGAWARFDLDRRLYADLLGTCRTVTCRATATAYYGAVTANSIRQGYRAPTEEPTTPWVAVAVAVVAVAIVTAPGVIRRSPALADRQKWLSERRARKPSGTPLPPAQNGCAAQQPRGRVDESQRPRHRWPRPDLASARCREWLTALARDPSASGARIGASVTSGHGLEPAQW